MMIRFFLKIYDALYNKRWLACTVTVGIVLLSLFLSLRIKYEEDISAFLPVDNDIEEYTRIYTEIGGQNRIAVIFRGETDHVISAMDLFGEQLIESDSACIVKDLQITIDEQQAFKLMEYVWEAYPLMLTDDDYQRMDSLFCQKDYIRRTIDENKQLLSLPIGNILTRSLPSDPLHLSSRITDNLKNNNISDHYQIIDNHIFSKDSSKGIVLLSSGFGISESKQNEKLLALLDDACDKVMAQCPSISISYIGAPVIAVGNASQIKSDSLLAVMLSIVLIFSVLYYSFRNWKDIGWIGMSIGFGWLFALGGLSILSDSVSLIVLGIGSIIIGIAANYPLHYLDHTKHERCGREVLKEMAPPLLIGNVTTVSAFLCLIFLDAKAMRDLGIFGSLMLIGTIIFVLVLLPSLLSKRTAYRKIYPMLPDIKKKMPRLMRKALLPLTCIITVILGCFSLNTQFDSDMQHINYMTEGQKDDLKFLSTSAEANDSVASVFLVSKAKTMEQALVDHEIAVGKIAHNNHIRKIAGISDFIISEKFKEERGKRWTDYWISHKDIIEKFKKETVDQGFSEDAFSPFLELSEQGVIKPLDSTSLDMIAKNFILKGNDEEISIVSVLSVDNDYSESVKQEIRKATAGNIHSRIYVFDNKDLSSSLVTVLSDSFNYIGFVCGFVVFIFLWLSFGRLELAIISFLPLAVSWLWILGIMDIFGVAFNIVNIILATFIFGQGDDYSIFITEGLTYEYTYGRKRLKTYRDSVALSAVLMFIGIATLILARHPALHSLAEVAIIGMITVVLMTFYLPPLVFRWLTMKHGIIRDIPITLERILFSLWAISFFLFFCMLFFVPYALFHSFFLSKSKRCRLFFHRVLQSASRFVIYRVPGTKFNYVNDIKETLEKPAVIICNHQSHLDVMCLLMMSPKIVILTNDWVWNNPFYGAIIHAAEFYPISDGLDKNIGRLKDLIERGYSVVVFPEGTRAKKRGVMHFHQGAFILAQKLKVDILPIMIHGLYDVLPKHDFMLRRGTITLEVHRRMKTSDIQQYGQMELTHYWHHWYVRKYKEMSRKLETFHYWLPYVRYSYMYKCDGVEKRCKSFINGISNGKSKLGKYIQTDMKIIFSDCRQSEAPLLLALANRDKEVYAYMAEKDLYDIAANISLRPMNLHLVNEEYIKADE